MQTRRRPHRENPEGQSHDQPPRPDNIAIPQPKGLAGAAKIAVAKMIEQGWLQEVDANLRRGEPLWRETLGGHGTTLVVTDVGLLAIGS